MSSCNIPFTTSNISYIPQLPALDNARLSHFFMNESLTFKINRGAFAPKNIFILTYQFYFHQLDFTW